MGGCSNRSWRASSCAAWQGNARPGAGQRPMGIHRRKAAIAFAVALPLADLCGFCATAGYAQTAYRHFAESALEENLTALKLKSAVTACHGAIPIRGGGCYR